MAQITVRIYKRKIVGPQKAWAAVTLDNEFTVHGIKVMARDDGSLLSFPARKDARGEFQDVFHPVTKEAREKIIKAVLEAYQKATCAEGFAMRFLLLPLTLLLLLFPSAYAQITPEQALSTAQHSMAKWSVSGAELGKDVYEVSVTLDGREIFKIRVSASSAPEAQLIAAGYLSNAGLGSPALKKDVYEIPVLVESREIARVKVNAQTGEIAAKKEKTLWQKMKGGSPLGHSLGIIGTALLAAAQLYSLRKREAVIQKGMVKTWLNLHVYLGLLGPLLVLLHAGFPFEFKYVELFKGGLAGLSTYLMLIVVGSGFIGRYLYRRMDERGKKLFRRWRSVHVPLVGAMFFTVAVHVIKTLIKD